MVGFYELSHKIKYNIRDKLFLIYNMYWFYLFFIYVCTKFKYENLKY